jgi:hypothetical protein
MRCLLRVSHAALTRAPRAWRLLCGTRRAALGLPPLALLTVDLVGATSQAPLARKLSSSGLRELEAAQEAARDAAAAQGATRAARASAGGGGGASAAGAQLPPPHDGGGARRGVVGAPAALPHALPAAQQACKGV